MGLDPNVGAKLTLTALRQPLRHAGSEILNLFRHRLCTGVLQNLISRLISREIDYTNP